MPVVANDAHDTHPAAATPSSATAHKATWQPDKDERADLDAINAALSRMREHVRASPYIMTIPQDEHLKYQFRGPTEAYEWARNAPFDPNTEHHTMQYLTFNYFDPSNDMYMLHNSRPIAESAPNGTGQHARPGTGSNTPNAGSKRKISLNAYKRKQNGGSKTPESDPIKGGEEASKQIAAKGPIERVKAETQEMLAAVAEDNEEEQRIRKDRSPEQGDLKRKRSTSEEQPKEIVRAEPALKKHRKGKEEPTIAVGTVQKVNAKTQAGDRPQSSSKVREDEGLPPRLSPGIPPRPSSNLPEKLSPLRESPGEKSSGTAKPQEYDNDPMPPRLTPTLPANITKTLQARASLHSASQPSNTSAPSSASKPKEDKSTPLRKSESGITKHKSPVPRNGFRARSGSPSVPSDVEDRAQSKTSAIPRAKSPLLSKDDEMSFDRAEQAKRIEQPPKGSLVVKLKYKKARREDITRILKMRPKPDARMSQMESLEGVKKFPEKRSGVRKDDVAININGTTQRIEPAKRTQGEEVHGERSTTTAEKRRVFHDDRDGASAKRKKGDEPEKRKEPSTPVPRELDSPLAPKSLHVTPSTRRDLLSQAMKREQSQDSNLTHTPPALTTTPSLNGSSQSNGFSKPPSSQPSHKTPLQQAWENEQTHLEVLGRELKHAASAHFTAQQTNFDPKLAAIKSLESFLCYLMAFTCCDEAAMAADPKQAPSYRNWRSLQGFYHFVKRMTDSYAPLNGLACSLGIVFAARILEISTQVVDKPSREILIETQSLLQKAASAADEKLDVDALQDAFPESWRQRCKRLAGADRLEPGKLGGQYKLPIGVATTPVRAARAGYAMLHEWKDREKIDYQLKLKL